MGDLNNSELLLLCNLIYLKFNVFKENNVGNLIEVMLYKNNLKKSLLKNNECKDAIKENEWLLILKQIQSNYDLMELTIKDIDTDFNGIKAACFTYKNDNTYVVFRGTKTMDEWSDNGEGAYLIETKEQMNALDYINKINYKNIVVTGHSKGGNKAKYVTILTDKIKRCISFNGQGFSNEFIDKYSKLIKGKKQKILSINAKYDYVNCLLNSLNEKRLFIHTPFQKNPFYYHKPNIMLNADGYLREEVNSSLFIKIINDFSVYLISQLSEPYKTFLINSLTYLTERILCKKKLDKNILQIATNVISLWEFKNHYNLKLELNLLYNLLKSFSLPLIFWNDFIEFEKNKSETMLYDILKNFKSCQDNIIFKLNSLGKEGQDISVTINNATYNLINSFEHIALLKI